MRQTDPKLQLACSWEEEAGFVRRILGDRKGAKCNRVFLYIRFNYVIAVFYLFSQISRVFFPITNTLVHTQKMPGCCFHSKQLKVGSNLPKSHGPSIF